MSGFSRVAYLLSEAYEDGENGRQVIQTGRRRVFVNPFTLSMNSFQEADAIGMIPSHVLQIHASDYHGEERIEYRGEVLAIREVRETGRGEFLRLTCTQEVADDE